MQQHLGSLRKKISLLESVQTSLTGLTELASLAEKSGDAALYDDVLLELSTLHDKTLGLMKSLLLSEPADLNGAYIDVKAGSGGTEASDWAGMLARMYTKWAQSQGFSGALSAVIVIIPT